ncbi:hypothetical protein OUZ56_006294 [Daphnia magna]|uniref:Uncharacterized protein n=1 Tax=Daphnia magna TaxID=35525 RepID=A0ABQ9YVA5_9CRUS|nr:hypothetical protein OUZ56_006294 [Daphnia magna]
MELVSGEQHSFLRLVLGLSMLIRAWGQLKRGIHNSNGFEEDIDGVLYKYMFVGRATEEFRILLLSHMLRVCKTKG